MYAQLGDGWKYGVARPLAGGVGNLAMGANQSFFIKRDGTLWGLGDTLYGQLGETTLQLKTDPVQIASDVRAVASGPRHEFILKTDGTLWAAGENRYAWLGDGTTTSQAVPVQVASGVSSMSTGAFHSVFVKTDGTLWGMGMNGAGALNGVPGYPSTLTPVQLVTWSDPLAKVSAVSAGYNFTLILRTDGLLFGAGQNTYSQLGDGTTINRSSLVLIDTNVRSISAGTTHSLYIKNDGTLWGMGSNAYGQLGLSSATTIVSTPIEIANDVKIAAAAAQHSIFLKNDGTLWGVGYNYDGELGDGTTTQRFIPIQTATGVANIAAAGTKSAYLTTDGTMWVMGTNSSGQNGRNPSPICAQPILMETGVTSATGGYYSTLVLKSDGTLLGCGSDTAGQLGLDTGHSPALHPSLETVASNVRGMAAGLDHSLYVQADQTLWAVGANSVGQLGDGTTINRDAPVQIATGVSAAAAGSSHSLYLKTDQTLWAMGWNNSGQLGDNTTTNRSTPIQVATGVTATAAGDQHSLFLKSDGTLWGMGQNNLGQLGDGTTTTRKTPIQIASGVKAVAAELAGTLYLKTDGTFWATGSNEAGQLGDGTTTNHLSPVQVAADVSSIAGGRYHVLVLKTDGTVWTAGHNIYGQLGDGTTTDRHALVKIASDAVAVGASQFTSFFIQTSGAGTAPAITIQPASTKYTAGTPFTLSVTATGTAPMDYTWRKNGVRIPGAHGPDYTVPSAQPDDIGTYDVVVTNAADAVTSEPAEVSSKSTPVLTWASPDPIAYGTALSATQLNATADVAGTFSYSPAADTVLAVGAGQTLSVTFTPDDPANYSVVTATQKITVTSLPPGAPTNVAVTFIDGVPQVSFMAPAGNGGTAITSYTATATAVGNGAVITATGSGSAIAIPGLSPDQSYVFSVTATNNAGAGPAASLPDPISPASAPLITSISVARQVVEPGQAVVLQVALYQNTAASYQWYHTGQPISGATTASLSIPHITLRDAGAYQVVMTNAQGSARSQLMFVLVAPATTKVVAWGYNPYGQTNVPATLHRPVAVSANSDYSLVLEADGTVVGWGQNDYGRAAVPGDLADVVAISAGEYHALALKADGTVVAWGQNGGHETDVPPGLTKVIAVAAGTSFSLAIKADGTVVGWGYNIQGQIQMPDGLANVVALAPGVDYTLAAKADGTVVKWGNPTYSAPIPAGLTDVVALAIGSNHAMALKSDGTPVAWARDGYAYLNVVPSGLANVQAIAAGRDFDIAAKTDGTITTWGVGPDNNPAGLSGVFALAAGSYHIVAVQEVKTMPVITWAAPAAITYGAALSATQLNAIADVPGTFSYSPAAGTVLPVGAGQVLSATFTPDDSVHYAIITATTPITVAGRLPGSPTDVAVTFIDSVASVSFTAPADNGGTAITGYTVTATPVSGGAPVTATGGTSPIAVPGLSPDKSYLFSVTATNGTGPGASGSLADPVSPGSALFITNVSAARQVLEPGQTLELQVTLYDTTGVSYQWYHTGQPIDGATSAELTIPNITLRDAGAYQVIVTNTHGSARSPLMFVLVAPARTKVTAWGITNSWQTGTPTTLRRPIAATANYEYSLILEADGSVVGWGFNDANQVNVPAGLDNVVAISAGYSHALALKADGTVVAWGYSGPGSTPQSQVPAGLTHVIAVSAGKDFSLALKTDGTVVGWGYNGDGESQPPDGLTNVIAISAGRSDAVALKADGTVVQWGGGDYGSPMPAGLAGVTAASVSYKHGMALKADGTVTVWSQSGEYGVDASPLDLANVEAIAIGWFFDLALKADGTVVGWGAGPVVSSLPADLVNVFSLAAGSRHAVALSGITSQDTPTITWAAPAAITYSTALSAIQLNATASVPGTFSYSPGAGTVLNAGANQTLHVTFTPLDTASYTGATSEVPITVNKASPPITWSPSAITYGTPLSAEQLNASASITGTFVYTPAPGTVLNAGANALRVTFTPTDTSNYNATTAEATILVGQDIPGLAWTTPDPITYGTPLSETQLNATAKVPGTFFYYDKPGTVLAAGAHTLFVSFQPTDTINYRAVVGTTHLAILPAPLTATAADQTRLFGDANPVFTINYGGFVNNDTAAAIITAPTAGTAATTTSPAGTYPITLTGGTAANYTLTLVPGTLTIIPRDYRGTYFGTFGSGGHWALYVRSDNTATYLAYLPSRSSAIVVNLTVNADGTFTVAGTELKAGAAATAAALALTHPEAPVVRTAAATAYTLAGRIGTDGAITGQLAGLGETFTGTADPTTGPAQASAGYYTASALGTASGATYAIVSPTGQAFVVTTGASIDSASGTVDANGQLTTTTTASAALSLTINASAQTVSALITPAGSSTPITYTGLPDTVTPVARVVNLSVRTTAGTNDQTLIVGLVVNGSGNKTLLVRGVGPGIAALVPGALGDPKLRLLASSGAELEANNDWDSNLTTAFARLGATALAPGSKDAAIYRAIPGGAYSFHVYPNDNGSGIALAELYDADPDPVPAEVVNISARTQVGTGNNILIAGFVIQGNAPKTILIRGLGPTLTGLGVTGALADPQLYLFKEGTIITSNDDWGGTSQLKAAFGAVGAGPLAADTSKDAALLVTLEPGVYSAQVSGVADTTGVGLVEIFLLP